LVVTSVVKLATNPSNAKLSKKLMNYFLRNQNFRKKLLSLLIQDKSEEEDDYYSESSMESEYESSPIPTLNVLTNKSQKEFLLDLIGQIPDENMKREYLEKLKTLILEEEDKGPRFSLSSPSSSLSNIYNQFPIPNPFQQVTTKDLQTEIDELKIQVRYLKIEIMSFKTAELTLEAKIALLQSQKSDPAIPSSIPVDILGFLKLKSIQHNF